MAAARVFRVEFRMAVAQRILNGESVSALSNEFKIKRSVLDRWRDCYREQGSAGLSRAKGRPPGRTVNAVLKAGSESAAADHKVAELERRLGRLAMENYFLKRAFQRVEAARSKNNAPGEALCTEKGCSWKANPDCPLWRPVIPRV
jgi:transposase-like protein